MCCLRVAPHKGTRADQKTVDVHGKISLKKVCCFLLTQRYNEVKFFVSPGLDYERRLPEEGSGSGGAGRRSFPARSFLG